VRRRWPIAILAALVIVYVSSSLLGVQFTPFVSSASPNLAIAIFTVADRYDRRTSLLAYAIAALATWAALGLGIYLHPGLDQDAVQAGAMIPGWFIGDAVRTRRNYRRALARQAERQSAQTEARIRAEERLRLSRDVHDVVSHSLSMIAVRSGVARLVLDEQPGEARAALAAIETASRSALDEVRQLLRQIREPAQADPGDAAVTRDIADLVRRFAENGLEVSYRATGPTQPGSYGAAVEMSAYRIAQEALTNVTRHASASHAVLEITREPHAMTITVTDDGGSRHGPGGPGPRNGEDGRVSEPGLGIAGMRERALLHGGTFRAGPLATGGFEVFAVLPSEQPGAALDGAGAQSAADGAGSEDSAA
jgi:signal transduction histidine kinase